MCLWGVQPEDKQYNIIFKNVPTHILHYRVRGVYALQIPRIHGGMIARFASQL